MRRHDSVPAGWGPKGRGPFSVPWKYCCDLCSKQRGPGVWNEMTVFRVQPSVGTGPGR
jgi:hypothetical protein